MEKYIGYHGTTKIAAQSIMKDYTFKVSTEIDDWLGSGIYFFEDDCKQAYNFTKKARKVATPTVIKANIEAEYVFDLLLTEAYDVFSNVHNKILSRLKEMYDGNTKFDNYNGLIINYICAKSPVPFDMVRGVFKTPRKCFPAETTIGAYQIQLCVRNQKCIKSIEEVSCNDERRLPENWKVLV